MSSHSIHSHTSAVDLGLTEEEAEIIDNVTAHAYDQSGCRMIQRKLEDLSTCSPNFTKMLVQSMLHIMPEVMTNQFGNYLCQKMIEVSDNEQVTMILNSVLSRCVEVSYNVHGTRVIQTLVEIMSQRHLSMHNQLLSLIEQMKDHVLDLATHTHGNHVIQAFLVSFKSSDRPSDIDQPGSEQRALYTQFIFESCMTYCKEIGSHKHGCCVMQRCLEKGRMSQKLDLADVIIQKLSSLIEDPYGNYLVQNVLKLDRADRNE